KSLNTSVPRDIPQGALNANTKFFVRPRGGESGQNLITTS
ncbi:1641_t:CDS:1, partial [Dentiscutata erythropus]